jgi:hypothetical protein
MHNNRVFRNIHLFYELEDLICSLVFHVFLETIKKKVRADLAFRLRLCTTHYSSNYTTVRHCSAKVTPDSNVNYEF